MKDFHSMNSPTHYMLGPFNSVHYSHQSSEDFGNNFMRNQRVEKLHASMSWIMHLKSRSASSSCRKQCAAADFLGMAIPGTERLPHFNLIKTNTFITNATACSKKMYEEKLLQTKTQYCIFNLYLSHNSLWKCNITKNKLLYKAI